jgi:DNA-binding transcriptional LysR family regulator
MFIICTFVVQIGTMKSSASLASLPNLEAFVASVEAGSFSRAAKRLSVTPQATSRAVARLEESLGATLFRRSTRKLEITEQGRSYYEACRDALKVLSSAERGLRDRAQTATGKVRISVATTYGHHRLLPTLAEFRRAHPGIELELNLTNRTVDFVQEGFDVAIRMGAIRDASFNQVKLGQFSVGVFASPHYLRLHGTPKTPEALAEQDHACVVFLMPKTGRPLPWSLRARAGGALREMVPKSALQVSEDVLGMVTLATHGAGLIQLYHFTVEREVARGELIEVLREYGGLARPFSLVYPRSEKQSKAVRTFIDFVRDRARSI